MTKEAGIRTYVTGSEACALAVKAARPGLVTAYPITPQTEIVEKLALYKQQGLLDCEYIHPESEHSVLAACIGAASLGVRTFTATSAHGLAYMHEMLHWAAMARLPIVMANACRALGPGWNIWVDHQDSLSQRDTGWIQIYASTVQEAYDITLMAFRIAEDERVLLPIMVCLDGFLLTHIMQPLYLIDEQLYQQAYLPPINIPHAISFDKPPHTLGQIVTAADHVQIRFDLRQRMEAARTVVPEAMDCFQRLFGRSYQPVCLYRTDDAEILFIALGTLAQESEEAVDLLRSKGIAAGAANIHLFRPFPKEIANLAARKLVVVDRSYSPGCGGILAQEVKQVLFDAGVRKEITNVICGLGGQNVSFEELAEIADRKGEIWWGIL